MSRENYCDWHDHTCPDGCGKVARFRKFDDGKWLCADHYDAWETLCDERKDRDVPAEPATWDEGDVGIPRLVDEEAL
jgi:hypothetical protein